MLAVAEDRGVTITHVLETHMHNDYVTGGLALAATVGAQYLVNAADPVSFRRTPVADGEQVKVGDMRIRVVATPGHTFTHLSYLLADGDQVLAAFTGGSLLNGTTGRTDLLGDSAQGGTGQGSVRLGAAACQRAAGRGVGLPDAWLRELLLGYPGTAAGHPRSATRSGLTRL